MAPETGAICPNDTSAHLGDGRFTCKGKVDYGSEEWMNIQCQQASNFPQTEADVGQKLNAKSEERARQHLQDKMDRLERRESQATASEESEGDVGYDMSLRRFTRKRHGRL